VFQLGQVKDTAMGRVGSKSATSQMASSVESVNLLGGLITADLVKASGRATKEGGSRTFSDAGSKFVNLVVAGRPIGNETGPNTAIKLPGIGTLWLHRVIRTSYSVEIRMIDLEVKQENPFGLKPGSKLQIAVARALVLP
ncbi:MAG TPA: choice-of-anchor P family protein, partial [Actinomycetota bacterium]|nr:choice-of-anchor P family protein [Actinomycetota bacterium]